MQVPAESVIRIDGTRAERALLASLILGDGEARAECERLDPETLQGEVERRILRAAQTVLRRGDALTNVAVAEELDRMPAGRGMTEAQAEMRLTDFVAEWGFDAPPAADCAAIIRREHLRRQLGSDHLHGATMQQSEREIGEGDLIMECLVKGNRVRRFKEFDPLPEPVPVVPLL